MTDFQPMLARIKILKKERNLTNGLLASAAGIPLSTLSKFLSGIIKDPSLKTIIKIAKALDTSADYLIFGEKKAMPALYFSLNAEGREKADEYIELLSVSGRYGAHSAKKQPQYSLAANERVSADAIIPDEPRHT